MRNVTSPAPTADHAAVEAKPAITKSAALRKPSCMRLRYWLLFMIAAFSNLLGAGVAAGQTVGPADAHLVRIPLPADISGKDLLQPAPALKERLHQLTKQELAAHGVRVDDAEAGTDRIVVFLDHDGSPILPDLQATRARAVRGVAPATADNNLSFTFDSPAQPWSGTEVSDLNAALRDFYPMAKIVYGAPAFSITVNVRKDDTITYAGLYYLSLNEMVLRDAVNVDVLCHETIHAFRDDNIIGAHGFEEGMTRTAEIEIFARLEGYPHWDPHHSYGYDVYYEALNVPAIAAQGGNFYLGYASPLLRYQLAGYAWAKAVLENPRFLADFNTALYARTLLDPATPYTESTLLEIAAAIQADVEGEPFLKWFARQYVLNTTPAAGYVLYQRINSFTVDFFYRDSTGIESMQADQTIDWSVYDHADALLSRGSEVTTSLGWTAFSPILPPGYSGRIKVVVSATSPQGRITNTALRPAVDTDGVFGVVHPANSGTVTLTPVSAPASAVTVPVVNGAFSAPSLHAYRGKLQAKFQGPGFKDVVRFFTKDASNYFLPLVSEAATPTALTVGLDIKPGNAWNYIDPYSLGYTPVAILSSSRFNAPANVRVASLTFGRTGDERSLYSCNRTAQDVNSDGLPDLICHFRTVRTGFRTGDTKGVLKGETHGGTRFSGADIVRIRPFGQAQPGAAGISP